MKIYFEKIRPYYYPLLRYFIARGYKIYMFNFSDYKVRKIKWLRDMLDSGKVLQVSPVIIGSDKFVLANIEKVSDFLLKASPMARSMVRLYKHEDLFLAYKKVIAKQLSDFYSIQRVLEKEQLSNAIKILLFPMTYSETLSLLKHSDGKIFELPKMHIPFLFKLVHGAEHSFLKASIWLKAAFVNLFVLLIVVCKTLFGYQKKRIPYYAYAIPITNPHFQFRFNEYRRFDFLLDHKDITKNNTIFLLFTGADKTLKEKLQTEKYRILDCSKKNIFLNPLLSINKNRKKVLLSLIRYTFSNLFLSLAEYPNVVKASTRLIYIFLEWTVILDNIHLSHYIVLNEEDFAHVGRNVLLSDRGAQSWCYAYSSTYGYTNIGKDISAQDMLHCLWFFLMYDHFVAWNSQTIEFHRLHPQKIGAYHNTGCFWSEFIMQGQKKVALSDFLEKYKIHGKDIQNNYKVVSFFDSSYLDSVAHAPIRFGIKFYHDIKRLLDEEANLFVVIKEKKPYSFYADKRQFIYSKDHKSFFHSIDQNAKHPRCCVAEYNTDPTDIIKVSDLTVSYAFSSTAVEALGARKKAIFYDCMEKGRGRYYAAVPDLVAHGYEELKNLVRKLLYQTTDQQYEAYLDSQILGKVDDYLDGQGLTRFRNLLAQAG